VARGGYRAGAGRPKGSPNASTAELQTRLDLLPNGTLVEKLDRIASDESIAIGVRLAALRHLFGALAGRVASTPVPGPSA
jgi:hypothetical protein